MQKIAIFSLFVLFLVACAPFESNYNKYEQHVVESQLKSKIENGVIEDSFYIHNSIRPDQAMHMNDMHYLVFYHKGGYSKTEKEFETLLKKYKSDKDSLNVYLVDMSKHKDSIGLVRLIFVVRDHDIYLVQNTWLDADDVEVLPYKSNN